jgi:pyruvate-formate lyase-activating enzyme
MGYNIEVSYNFKKYSSVTDLNNTIKHIAKKYNCTYCYEDYEFENNVQYERRHCVITVNFDNTDINQLVHFLKSINNMEGVHIELIYDEIINKILYASTYYQTQKMDKKISKEYKIEKRERIYSEYDTMILDAINKNITK